MKLRGFIPLAVLIFCLLPVHVQAADDGAYQLFPKGDTRTFTVEANAEGYYCLTVDFKPNETRLSNIDISVEVNGETPFDNIRLPVEWTDAGPVGIDRYGNEVVPMQKIISKPYTVLMNDYKASSPYPYEFYLQKGANTVEIANLRTDFFLAGVAVAPVYKAPNYAEYQASYSGEKKAGGLQSYEAELISSKNISSILPESVRDPSASPYDTQYLKLNVLGGEESMNSPGDQVNWIVSVPETGLYNLTFKMKQLSSEMNNAPVYRTIQVDDQIPFAELESYRFDFTGKWKNYTLGGADPYWFYLTSGEHKITMTVDGSRFEPVYQSTKQIIEEINETTLSLKKLTGNVVDKYREWDLSEFMPDAAERLNHWVDEIERNQEYLLSISSPNTKYVSFNGVALASMRNIAENPNDLPNQLSALSGGSSSVYAQLTNVLSYVEYQPMAMDMLYLHGSDTKVPAAEVGTGTKISESLKRFFLSFMPMSYASGTVNESELNVWAGRNRYYVTLLQQMADTEFTEETGIKVTFSMMPNENKLILAIASGSNPDMVLGASTDFPYNLATRGAAADLASMDGFKELAKTVQPGSMVSYMIDDKVYGFPETQDYWIMFYRTDILEKLGLRVPETWQDVINMLPTLQRYGMNFATNLSTFESYKPFSATVPFIYQHGGDIINSEGSTTAITSEASLKGIKMMTDMFNIYSTPMRVTYMHNEMARGDIPIGIGNFATYLQLTYAADEIAGLWDVAPLPGIKDENGRINRTAPGAAQCSIIFENSDRKEEAWEFLKWYSSTETQISYGNRLYTTVGDGFIWNTANVAAFRELPMPDEHKEVIMEQWEQLVELPRVPGYYMIERELSNIWNAIVMEGKPIAETVDNSAIIIDREIMRKMEEFHYAENGKMVKTYHVPTVESIVNWLEGEGAYEE